MKKVLTIGGAMSDMLIEYADAQVQKIALNKDIKNYLLLEEGKKIEAENVSISEGGGAVNAAVSFARQGLTTSIICKVGTDDNGDRITKKLADQQIDTQYIIHSKNGLTGMSFIIPFPSGDRAVLVYSGVNKTLRFEEVNQGALGAVDQIYFSALRGAAMVILPRVAQYAHEHGINVAVNPGSGQLRTGAVLLIEALPYIQTLILNAYEAGLLLGSLREHGARYTPRKVETMPTARTPHLLSKEQPFDLLEFCARVMQMGVSVVVITNGAEGVYVASGNNLYFHASIPTKVVSTLGAGDAFGSGFVGSMLMGLSVEQSMIRGLVNSSSVLGYAQTQTGLLANDQLTKRSLDIGSSGVQKFILV